MDDYLEIQELLAAAPAERDREREAAREAAEAACNIERRAAYELRRRVYALLRNQPAPKTIMLCGDRRGGGLYAVR